MKKDIEYRIRFSEEEMLFLRHLLNHFSDYVWGDDRPDHGWGILKKYREASDETKVMIGRLYGRILFAIKRKHKKYENNK